MTLFVFHVILKISNRRRLLWLQWCELAIFKKQKETFEKKFNCNYILYLSAVLGKDFVLVFKLNGQMNNFYIGWVFSKKKLPKGSFFCGYKAVVRVRDIYTFSGLVVLVSFTNIHMYIKLFNWHSIPDQWCSTTERNDLLLNKACNRMETFTMMIMKLSKRKTKTKVYT